MQDDEKNEIRLIRVAYELWNIDDFNEILEENCAQEVHHYFYELYSTLLKDSCNNTTRFIFIWIGTQEEVLLCRHGVGICNEEVNPHSNESDSE